MLCMCFGVLRFVAVFCVVGGFFVLCVFVCVRVAVAIAVVFWCGVLKVSCCPPLKKPFALYPITAVS